MRLVKVDTLNQLADNLTKPLQLQQFLACLEGIWTGPGQHVDELHLTGPIGSGGGKSLPSTLV